MEMSAEFVAMISEDIHRIENSEALSSNERYRLHRELDGRYQACIRDWHKGLWGASYDGKTFKYGSISSSPAAVQENLSMMKAKLDTYKFQMNAIEISDTPSTQINVTTNLNVNISFEETRRKIEDMTALSQEQTDEIIEKIDELENIAKEDISRKKKWEKVKPILSFALDKGADIATAIMALVLQMKLGLL